MQNVFNLDAVVVVTVGVAVQAMLVGMPAPRHLHRVEVDGQVLITVGSAVLFSYDAADAGLRNLAAVTLPEMGFTGRRVAHVLGITQEYVSMLRTRARAEGSAGLMRRRGRPAALGARDLGRARSWRAGGVTDAAIGKRLDLDPDAQLARPHLGRRGLQMVLRLLAFNAQAWLAGALQRLPRRPQPVPGDPA